MLELLKQHTHSSSNLNYFPKTSVIYFMLEPVSLWSCYTRFINQLVLFNSLRTPFLWRYFLQLFFLYCCWVQFFIHSSSLYWSLRFCYAQRLWRVIFCNRILCFFCFVNVGKEAKTWGLGWCNIMNKPIGVNGWKIIIWGFSERHCKKDYGGFGKNIDMKCASTNHKSNCLSLSFILRIWPKSKKCKMAIMNS